MRKKLSVLFIGTIAVFFVFEIALRLVGLVENSKSEISKKESAQYVILTLGNSYTAGNGAPKGKSYPSQLQNLLDQRSSKKYQVVNYGKGNVNSTYIREQLPKWMEQNSPNLVFIMTGEPNGWNKYGYNAFLESRNKEKISWFSKLEDLFRGIKVYRFLELLINKRMIEDLIYGHSSVFTAISLGEKDRLALGYTWVGHLQHASIYTVYDLNKEQIQEAEKSIEYVIEKDQSMMASFTMAMIKFEAKQDLVGFYHYANLSVDQWPYFHFGLWRYLQGHNFSKIPGQHQAYDQLKKKMFSKTLPRKIEEVEKWHQIYDPSLFVGNDFKERASFLFDMVMLNPTDGFNFQRLIMFASESPKSYEALKVMITLNPLSPVINYALSAKSIIDRMPDLKEKVLKDFKLVGEKVHRNDLLNSLLEKNLEEEWVLSDLEKIIQQVHLKGAKVVVQTYPPRRSGQTRDADRILRRWSQEKVFHNDLAFMDVGKSLEELFSQKNGGDKYYSNEFGQYDDHQNEVGNELIAKLMLNYVD